jgi:hypothetical protein
MKPKKNDTDRVSLDHHPNDEPGDIQRLESTVERLKSLASVEVKSKCYFNSSS